MKKLVLYIHGKGGCAGESERYKPLFPGCEVAGLDYQTYTPWETGTEIREAVTKMNARQQYRRVFQHECRDRCDDPQRILHFPYRRYGEADP